MGIKAVHAIAHLLLRAKPGQSQERIERMLQMAEDETRCCYDFALAYNLDPAVDFESARELVNGGATQDDLDELSDATAHILSVIHERCRPLSDQELLAQEFTVRHLTPEAEEMEECFMARDAMIGLKANPASS